MTEQEQIKAIKQIIDERVETTLGQVQGRHGNVIKTVDTIIIARDIVNAGYGDVSEYKAEREMLGSQIKVLKQRLNDKYIEVDNLNRDYSNAFERLKAQEREIERLQDKCEELRNEKWDAQDDLDCYCDEMPNKIKQAQIDVLNKLKSSAVYDDNYLDGYVFIDDVNKLIEEVKDAKDKS